jgi:hypothetical protein
LVRCSAVVALYGCSGSPGDRPGGDVTGEIQEPIVTRGTPPPPPTFISFDVPGAGPFGTFPQAINPAQVIAGTYFDASNTPHGFVRTKTARSPRSMRRAPSSAPQSGH